MGRVRAVTRLCESYPGICLITEEKARKNLSQGKNPEAVSNKGRNMLMRTLKCILLVICVLYTGSVC
jgi:hypothetical protein